MDFSNDICFDDVKFFAMVAEEERQLEEVAYMETLP